MNNLTEELGQVAGRENKAFSIITHWSVKTTLKKEKFCCHGMCNEGARSYYCHEMYSKCHLSKESLESMHLVFPMVRQTGTVDRQYWYIFY